MLIKAGLHLVESFGEKHNLWYEISRDDWLLSRNEDGNKDLIVDK